MPIEDRLHGWAARYVAAPQWVKSIIGSAYSLIPENVRLGPAYGKFLQIFNSPPPHLAYARMRLQETLTHALNTVPAYRSFAHLLDKVADDPTAVLVQLPLTDKECIKRSLDKYLSVEAGARRLRMFTGGSTAIPMTFFLTQGVSRAKEWAAFRALAHRHDTDGDGVVLALRGRTVGTARNPGGKLWSYEPIKRHLIVSSDHLEARYMASYVDAIQRWRPRYVHAFPSALYPLVRWLAENNLSQLLGQVRGVLLTSESVFPYQMNLFQQFFECPVIVHYGHTERVLFAHTLPQDPRYFFWPHYGHFELVKASGKPVSEPGEIGEIIGTSFDNRVMPFVRYRTGDYAVLSERPSPPGYEGFPVCERIEGRLQEFVVCRDRRLISVTTLGSAHFDQLDRCVRIQYEQRTEGELLLRVVQLAGAADVDTIGISAAVEEKTQGGCSVIVQKVESIPLTSGGKQRLLLQHLDISSFLGASREQDRDFPDIARARVAEEKVSVAVQQQPLFALDAGGRFIVMVGTDPDMRGGIASAINTYREAGVFQYDAIKYVSSHVDTGRWNKVKTFLSALIWISSKLACGRVRGIHAHVSSKGSFWRKSLILALARTFGVKTIFHLHSGGFDQFAERNCGPVAQWWIRRTLQRSDGVIALSSRWENWVRRFAPGTKTYVLSNPVTLPHRSSDAERLKQMVFLGLICDAKGTFDLLKAFRLLNTNFPEWRLVVGGNGETDRFEREVAAAGLTEVVDFRGWIGLTDKNHLLDASSIFVLPSYAEGIPIGMLEAMAHSMPVVVTSVGGIPDVITDGVDGMLVSPGDIDALVDGLGRLMGSPDLRKSIGRAGRETADQFSTEHLLPRLSAIYADVGFLRDSAAPVRGCNE